MGAAGPQGRERASREAIDSENRVIRCANTASPPRPKTLPGLRPNHRATGLRSIRVLSACWLCVSGRGLVGPRLACGKTSEGPSTATLRLSNPPFGRHLLVMSLRSNRQTDGSLRYAKLSRQLPLRLDRLAQRSPDTEPRVLGQEDLDLSISQGPGPPDRVPSDRSRRLSATGRGRKGGIAGRRDPSLPAAHSRPPSEKE
jgi:hypothetical protein